VYPTVKEKNWHTFYNSEKLEAPNSQGNANPAFIEVSAQSQAPKMALLMKGKNPVPMVIASLG
jgi:hypothetical protein